MRRMAFFCLMLGPLFAQQVVRDIHKTTIVPDQFLRSYDPVTVFFSKPEGPGSPGPVDQPGELFVLEPRHPGTLAWLDAKTLQFTPTIAWPALTKFTVKVTGVSRVLQTFMSAPTEMKPHAGSLDLDPFSEITFSLRHPVRSQTLAAMVKLEVRNLPGLDLKGRYWLSEKEFKIKQLERKKISDLPRYQLTLNREIPFGKSVFFRVRLSLDTRLSNSEMVYQWQTKNTFQLVAAGAGYSRLPLPRQGSVFPETQALECPGPEGRAAQDRLFLEFSNDVGDINLVDIKKMVQFEPSVDSFNYRVSRKRIYFQFSARRATTYQMKIRHVPFVDTLGRSLDVIGDSSLFFYLPSKPSYLKWKAGLGILERFGPQEFSMEGQGGSQVDLRIYRIDPLDRNFWPFPEEGLAVNEEVKPAGPGEEPAFARNMAEHIRQMEAPVFSRIIELGAGVNELTHTSFGLNLKPYFKEITGDQHPGTYLVGMRELGKPTRRNYVRIQVTDLCLTTVEEEHSVLFAVTSLKTGKPIDGAIISVENEILVNGASSGDYKKLTHGTTDEFGFYRYEHKRFTPEAPSRIVVQKGSDYLVLDPDLAPPVFMDNHWYRSWRPWLSWWTHKPSHRKKTEEYLAHVFVERPVYRPEEKVHIKGYFRIKSDGKLTPGPHHRGNRIVIEGPGEKKWEFPITLTTYGSFYVSFLEKDLPTGHYSVFFINGKDNERLGFASFQKEAYRVPRFEVRLRGDAQVANDRPFKIALNANFYAGGKVADSEVEWQVTQRPFVYQPASFPGFVFSTSERYGQGASRNYETRHFNQRTDSDGSAEITINPQDQRDGKPRRYTVEATVRGADEQTVSATRRIVALPSFVLGMKLKRFLNHAKVIRPEILVLDHRGEPLAGQSVRLKLMQRQWHSYLRESDFTSGKAKYVTDVVDVPVLERDIESRDKPFSVELPVDQSGVYIVELTGRDRLGRAQKVQVDLFVSGEDAVAWEKPKQMVFETVWDKKSYEPGDQAVLLLKSPFSKGQALVVVEGIERNSYHWVTVKKGSATFNIQVNGKMAPQIPVHILLSRGRSSGGRQSQGFTQNDALAKQIKSDLKKPMAMGSTAWLKVKPGTYRAEMSLKHPDKVLPGQEIDIEIELHRPDGMPLDGEVTLWMVDRAVLALGKEAGLDPVPSFLTQHGAWVRLRDTRNRTIGRIPIEEAPGGGGGMAKAEDLFGRETVRRNFQTVPYYNPGIQVSSGKAVVRVTCPDNLTDFAVRAVVTDGNMRFGWAKSKLSVRLPVIVQPALPRFVRPGDEFTAGGMGRLVEGEGGSGRFEVQVEGLDLLADSRGSLKWEKGVPQRLYFPMKLPRSAMSEPFVKVRIGVVRESDKSKDAFEVSLPIKPDSSRKYLEKISKGGPQDTLELLDLRNMARQGGFEQSLTVSDRPELVVMLAALDYLRDYPYDCTEQRISRLMPELAMKQVRAKIGDTVFGQGADLAHGMQETLKYLEICQNNQGLFAYWPGANGYVHLTAYVVEFLLEAKDAGFTFKTSLLSNGLRALKESLRSDYSHFISESRFFERAQALSALASAGQFDESYATDFAARAVQADLLSESRIFDAFLKMGLQDTTGAKRMHDDLKKSLVMVKDGENDVYRGLQYRASSWGGLINASEISTMAGIARAMYRADPQSKQAFILLDELVAMGGAGGWGSTQANVMVLKTLNDVLEQEGEQNSLLGQITWNDAKEVLEADLLHWKTQNPGNGSFVWGSESAPEQWIAWQKASYLPNTPGYEVRSESNGFVVQRELQHYKEGQSAPDRYTLAEHAALTFSVGDILEEHIQLINPEQAYYVAIRIPIAAGFEPMNPHLATAPAEAEPEGQFTRNPSFAQFEDDQVTFYFDSLQKGTYHFYFRMKAMFEGNFTHPAAYAEKMYQQSVRGNSNATRIKIKAEVKD